MGRPLSSIDVLRTAIQLIARIFHIRASAVPLALGGLFIVLQGVRGLPAEAQTPPTEEWVWMGGSSTVPAWGSAHAVYGTRGVFSAGNVPGGRFGHTSWIDRDGNVWIFGGWGADESGVDAFLNDLWKFNPNTREWAWMSGGSTASCDSSKAHCRMPGVYGILRESAPENVPPGRYGAAAWVDSQGDLWLFGGCGSEITGYGTSYNQQYGSFNDLWKFDPAVGEWTWMGGSNGPGARGVYGTLGTPAAGNIPGARDSAITWTDRDGDVWLFGGNGSDSERFGTYLNDLWKFSPSTREWAWMSGSSKVTHKITQNLASYSGMPGVSAGVGVFNSGNVPGGRFGAAGSTDDDGNLWVSSGTGFDLAGNLGVLNDLWEFNATTSQWAWMGGTGTLTINQYGTSPGWLSFWSAVCETGTYEARDVFSPGNVPGCRKCATSWTSNGVFWMWGGVDSELSFSIRNDLWRYNPSTYKWAWMVGRGNTGESTPGVYGTLGIPDAANYPGARLGSTGWTDSSGNLWLFGGHGTDSNGNIGNLNDVWEYLTPPPPLPAVPIPTLSLAAGVYTTPQTVTISDSMAGATIHYTTDGSWPTGDSAVFGSPLTVNTTETLKAIAVAPGYTDSGVAMAEYAIHPILPAPTFSPGAGEYLGTQLVTIVDSVPGTTIYYTNDGSAPSTASNPYPASPLIIGVPLTLGAIATKSGYTASPASYAIYKIIPALVTSITLPATASVRVGSTTTIIATVSPANASNPTGKWQSTDLGIAAIDDLGQLTGVSTGTAEITAQSTDGSNITSNICKVTVDGNFSVTPATASDNSRTIKAGETAAFNLTVAPAGGNTLRSAVTLTVTGLPVGAIADFSPTTIAAGTGATKVILSIKTARASAFHHVPGSIGAIYLCLLLLPMAAIRRRGPSGDHSWRAKCILWLLLTLGVTAGAVACSGGHSRPPSVYALTIACFSENEQETTTVNLTLE